jgi:hypothetical protein
VLGGTALQVNERVTRQKSYKPQDISGDRAISQLTFCPTVQETLTPTMSGMQDARKPDTRHYDGRPEANLSITVRVPPPVLSLARATDYRLPPTDSRFALQRIVTKMPSGRLLPSCAPVHGWNVKLIPASTEQITPISSMPSSYHYPAHESNGSYRRHAYGSICKPLLATAS